MAYQEDKYYITAVLNGERAAFAKLVNKHKQTAFNLAFRITHNREDAEEVVQDAFVNVYRNLTDFEYKSKFTTWLFRIVYNLSVSKTRRKQIVQQTIDENIADNYFIESTRSDYSLLHDNERKFYVEKVMDVLDSGDQTILTLYYQEDCPIDEIAEITGNSVSNVKVKLFRARKRLYSELGMLLKDEVSSLL